jgi:Cu/Ag efflux pump CusA
VVIVTGILSGTLFTLLLLPLLLQGAEEADAR